MNRPKISSSLEMRSIGYLINVAVTDWQRHKITLLGGRGYRLATSGNDVATTLRLQTGNVTKLRCRYLMASFTSHVAATSEKMKLRQRRGYGLAMSPNDVTLFIIKLSLSVSRRGGPKPFLQQMFYSIK